MAVNPVKSVNRTVTGPLSISPDLSFRGENADAKMRSMNGTVASKGYEIGGIYASTRGGETRIPHLVGHHGMVRVNPFMSVLDDAEGHYIYGVAGSGKNSKFSKSST